MSYVKIASMALAASLLWNGAHGQTITKCQDAEGNWHYGNFAAEACAQDSKLTEIDERGIEVKESDAPPTQEELDARKEAEQQAKQEEQHRQRQAARDQQLLHTYDSAAAIVKARDERVKALERELESHRLFRQDLVEEKQALKENEANGERMSNLNQQIAQYDKAIEALENERDTMIEDFNQELARYRELTGE